MNRDIEFFSNISDPRQNDAPEGEELSADESTGSWANFFSGPLEPEDLEWIQKKYPEILEAREKEENFTRWFFDWTARRKQS